MNDTEQRVAKALALIRAIGVVIAEIDESIEAGMGEWLSAQFHTDLEVFRIALRQYAALVQK